MTIPFTTWLQSKILEKFRTIDQFLVSSDLDPMTASRWILGATQPSIEGQIKLADALGIPLTEIRNQLGLPHSAFGEYLIRRIMEHSTILEFCVQTEMQLTKVHKWLKGVSHPVRGNGAKEVAIRTALWLQKKGDDRNLTEIIDDLVCKIEGSRPPQTRYKRQAKKAKSQGTATKRSRQPGRKSRNKKTR